MRKIRARKICLWLVVCVLFIQIFPLASTGDYWTQTTQEDFETGTPINTSVTLSPGNVILEPIPTEWNKAKSNPVIDWGPPGSWDSGNVGVGTILWDGSYFNAWYHGNIGQGTTAFIGYARSKDGLIWEKPSLGIHPYNGNYNNNIIINGTEPWESVGVSFPAVIWNGTGYQMWYSGNDGSTWYIGLATSPDGIHWTKYPSNPVMSPGPESNSFGAHVLLDGGTYKMWYCGPVGADDMIRYAESPNGIDWTKFGVVLDSGPSSWDNGEVFLPYVLKEGNTFKMWYSGIDAIDSWTNKIGYAESPDGTNWTKYGGNPILTQGPTGDWDDSILSGAAVWTDGVQYRIWYNGFANGITETRIGHALSSDGINWTKRAVSPVIIPGKSGEWDDAELASCSIVKDNGIYKMWYSGHDGGYNRIGYATSTDGINWEKPIVGFYSYGGNYDNNIVVDIGAPGTWNEATSYLPTVLKDDGGYKMWFTGALSNVLSIGYATSPDGINWTEYPSNPVLSPGTYWWENTDAHSPSVINNSGLYEMWYTGVQNNQIGWIGYANSTDGITWTKHSDYVLGAGPSAWDAGEVFNPNVIKEGDTYEMWYVACHAIDAWTLQIGYATSSDGINWIKYDNNPIVSPGNSGQWDDYIVNCNCVIFDKTSYKMWYAGTYDSTYYSIGYATANYTSQGTFESSVFDSDNYTTNWNTISWMENLRSDTLITISIRTGNTSVPDVSWTGWSIEYDDSSGSALNQPPSRYIQYWATLTSYDSKETPILKSVTIDYGEEEPSSLYISMTEFEELVYSGQSYIFRCCITDGTDPVEGASVILTSNNGSSLEPDSGMTDYNGEFTFIFYSPTVDEETICRITIQAIKIGYNDRIDFFDTVVEPLYRIVMFADPSTVYMFESTTISVQIYHRGMSLESGFIDFFSDGGGWFWKSRSLIDEHGFSFVKFKTPVVRIERIINITADISFKLDGHGYKEEVTISIYVTPKPGADVEMLPVPYSYQGATSWCWANSMSMILRYYSINDHAWDIARYYEKGHDDGLGDKSKIKKYIRDYRKLSTEFLGREQKDVIWEWAVDQIDEGFPILFDSQIFDNEGHMTVIVGYIKSSNGDNYFIMHSSSPFYVNDNEECSGLWEITDIPKTSIKYMFLKVKSSLITDHLKYLKAYGLFSVKGIPQPKSSIINLVDYNIQSLTDEYLWLHKGLQWKNASSGPSIFIPFLQDESLNINYWIFNHNYYVISAQVNIEIKDFNGNTVYNNWTKNPIIVYPYSNIRFELFQDIGEYIKLKNFSDGMHQIHLGIWKFNTSYSEDENYDFVGSIFFYVGDPPDFFEFWLKCPANLTITNTNGKRIGLVDSQYINEIPNTVALSSDDPEIYIVPANDTYTIEVKGYDKGNYDLEFVLPYEDSTKTYSFLNTTLLKTTGDIYTLTPFGVSISVITNDMNKTYNLNISESKLNTTEYFLITNITHEKGIKYRYEVIYWDTISDESNGSVKLFIDENNDGIEDYSIFLNNSMTGEDINELIEQQRSLEEEDITEDEDELNWLLYLGIIVIIIGVIITAIILKRRRSGKSPDKEEKNEGDAEEDESDKEE